MRFPARWRRHHEQEIDEALASFDPLVREWFTEKFPNGPTEPQRKGWPAIRDRLDTLIAAPTGTGKTLTAFLAGIDSLIREQRTGRLSREIRILYISPLKALTNDIQRNLEEPLLEITELARIRNESQIQIVTAVRHGDSTRQERDAIIRTPPHILNTTPESLHLMLSNARSRAVLRTVRTVIIDEIHQLASNKRGTHLALSLARLDALANIRPARIGLSATQRPMKPVAEYLSGIADDGKPFPCTIIDLGHRREIKVWLEAPFNQETGDLGFRQDKKYIYDRIEQLAKNRRTTLVFLNSRAEAEEAAGELADRLGDHLVDVHHGAMSQARRRTVEEQMRAGNLRIVVATATLELGIDAGTVDLVCQIGSPGRIATFLQRVGRSGRALGTQPEGAIFPLSIDEWIEAAALGRCIDEGVLDALTFPRMPLDVLVQHICGEVTVAGRGKLGQLLSVARRAAPYRSISPDGFRAVADLCMEGPVPGQAGYQGLLSKGASDGELVPRNRTSSLVNLNSGTIINDGRALAIDAEQRQEVGELPEEFAAFLMPGNIFRLAKANWEVVEVDDEVNVWAIRTENRAVPARWGGDGVGRSRELSAAVGHLRREIDARLEDGPQSAEQRLEAATPAEPKVSSSMATRFSVGYLADARQKFGVMPTDLDLVFEQTWTAGQGAVIACHSCYGLAVNRSWATALAELELQLSGNRPAICASDEGFALLGEVGDAVALLQSHDTELLLTQAAEHDPAWRNRWREAATISLAVLRHDGNGPFRVQEQIEMAAQLYRAVLHDPAWNQPGDVEWISKREPIMHQAMQDYLHAFNDLEGLIALLKSIEAGDVRVHFVKTRPMSRMARTFLPSWWNQDRAQRETDQDRAAAPSPPPPLRTQRSQGPNPAG